MQPNWQELVTRAMLEDGAANDVTTHIFVPADAKGEATIFCRSRGVVCGTGAAKEAFYQAGSGLEQEWLVQDGDRVIANQPWVKLRGLVRTIVTGERVALNFLGHLSGIATRTAEYVSAISGTGAVLRDTRKTVPGLRDAQKYAVRVGGGVNHRMNLAAAALIKENHLVAAGGVAKAIEIIQVTMNRPDAPPIELEVESLRELEIALEAGVTEILLDNFTPELAKQAVELNRGRAILEASGGITIDNIRAFAEAGVQRISVGALTHTVTPLDLSLLLKQDLL